MQVFSFSILWSCIVGLFWNVHCIGKVVLKNKFNFTSAVIRSIDLVTIWTSEKYLNVVHGFNEKCMLLSKECSDCKIICNSVDLNYWFRNRAQFEWPWMTFSGGSCHVGLHIMMQINNMISKGANNLKYRRFRPNSYCSCFVKVIHFTLLSMRKTGQSLLLIWRPSNTRDQLRWPWMTFNNADAN